MRTHRLNQVTIAGRAGADGEVKEISNDKKVGSLSIATEDGYYDKNKQEFISKSNWHTVKGWGYVAEKIEKVCKGDSVLITGKLEYEKWEKDGEQKKTAVISVSFPSDIDVISESQNNNTEGSIETSDIPFESEIQKDEDGLPF